MFCSKCGKEINDEAVICVHCGCQVNENKLKTSEDKTFVATLLLCIFLGGFGAHHFYVGKIGTGIALLVLTLIGLPLLILLIGIIPISIVGIWVLIDLINICTNNFKTADGSSLVR